MRTLFWGSTAAAEAEFAALSGWVRERQARCGACHDFEHTLRVVNNSGLLLEALPEAEEEITRFAALLHDVGRPEEQTARGDADHAVIGAELAARRLLADGAGREFALRVAEAVRTHRFRDRRTPESVEAQIVFDADKLDSLGAVGVGRAFLFAGREGARLHNREEEALNGAPYGPEDTAYREYLVKLRRLPERMLTAPGRAMARERLEFMSGFFRRLDAEVFPEGPVGDGAAGC